MTGRDLIVYILNNNLENEQVFNDNTILGFMTIEDAAKKFDVGVHTVYAWIMLDKIDYIFVYDRYLIPFNCEVKSGGMNENTRKEETSQGVHS